MQLIVNILFSIGVSVTLIGVLVHFILSAAEPDVFSRIVAVVGSFSAVFLAGYLFAALIRTCLQAVRYRLLLRPAAGEPPSFFHLLLVTLSRNMFVDMLPARLGELSYIAMLNRGYRVSGQACISSLVISFIFDLVALTCLIVVLVVMQVMGGLFQDWMFVVLVVLVVVIGLLLVLVFPVLAAVNRWVRRIDWVNKGLFSRLIIFSDKVQVALDDTRAAGIVMPVLLLSLGIRVTKYLGLYCLFIGVVVDAFPEMTTGIVTVTAALISAEAGASLPIPAFMSFGTYEAAGMLALVVLGANSATSLVVMLAMHVISQVIDYLLGLAGVVAFTFTTSARMIFPRMVKGSTSRRRLAAVLLLLVVAGMFLAFELRSFSKRGTLIPPERGESVAPVSVSGSETLQTINGFVVWSSNRSGNHDIYLLRLPERQIHRVTTHPHSEYYPRISPDGRQIVFARGHRDWVSQRDLYAWDIVLLDLETGQERVVAAPGTMPTWSADGRRIFFLRDGTAVVELELATKRERILYQSGTTVAVPAKTVLETPDISTAGSLLAVTLRGAVRATARVDRAGQVRKIGNGCQLNWGPDDRYLYTIDHGGKMQNALYRVDPKTLNAEKWFDYPGEFSHEYFPRVDGTGKVLVYGASRGGHEHDSADYEIFLWVIGQPATAAIRLTYHTGNDSWPDIFLAKSLRR